MARLAIKIPGAKFEFEAMGPEDQITKWCDEAMGFAFKKDFTVSPAERSLDEAWERNGDCYATRTKAE